jgi:hypothetical protein
VHAGQIVALLGAQIAFVQKQLVNVIPPSAIRSMFWV